MSALHPGVLQGPALFLAPQAQLRSLQPAEVDGRRATGGGRLGVLRELVLLQAVQAKLRSLQPDTAGERNAAAGGDLILAA